ncbi:MAG: hypothetical protein F6J97_19520, partial [Leptolyngbya sp. SIO4C1]|nr:hypothetical protein [Leptolyngbya sp. SIO4C1]
MTSPSNDRLYQLLPAIYRIRDEAQGKPLEALLSIVAQELEILETDIEALYDDWFIETCAEWVVPYIGDLLDVRELYAESARTYGQQERRAYVANTLAYRRRKGTAPILEQLARDVTGWRARVVEFFERLAITQNLDRLRLESRFVSIRPEDLPQRLGTPFEQQTAYTVDIRPLDQGQSRYRAAGLGLFLWRLDSYPLEKVTPNPVRGPGEQTTGHYYSFSPLGYRSSQRYDRIPLFNRPRTETDITQFANAIHLPIELPCQQDFPGYLGSDPVLKIFVNGRSQPLPPAAVMIAQLSEEPMPSEGGSAEAAASDWSKPRPCPAAQNMAAQKLLTFKPDANLWQLAPLPSQYVVAVDPTKGRLAFLERVPPQQVEVSYAYGFSGDIGGGPYSRSEPVLRPAADRAYYSPLFWEVPGATRQEPNPLLTISRRWNQTVDAWHSLNSGAAIPLQTLAVQNDRIRRSREQSGETLRPQFQPGILQGLAVMLPGGSDLLLTSGRAVDDQGRQIALDRTVVTDLGPHQGLLRQNALLVIAHSLESTGSSWQLHLIAEADIDDYPSDRYIQLAYLSLDAQANLTSLDTEQLADRLHLNLRPTFQPGIVDGLDIEIGHGAVDPVAARPRWQAAGLGEEAQEVRRRHIVIKRRAFRQV